MDEQREKFQAWAETHYRNADTYSKRDFDHGLAAWQACAAALSQPAAADEVRDALADLLEIWPNRGRLPGWCQRWTKALNRGHDALAKATP